MFARLLIVLAVITLSVDTFAGPPLRNGEGFAISNGTKIWYRVEGASRPGVPILIIHGGPGETARPFELTIGPLLAMSRPVVYTDYRGAGRSDRPAQSGESLPKRFEAIFGALEPGWQSRMMAHNPAGYNLLEAMQAQLSQELGGKSLMAPQLVAGLFESGFFAFDAFAHAQKLKMPILVLVGRVDKELSIDNSVLFSASVPDGRFVAVEDAGHFPYIEAPAPTLSAIEAFLEGLPKG